MGTKWRPTITTIAGMIKSVLPKPISVSLTINSAAPSPMLLHIIIRPDPSGLEKCPGSLATTKATSATTMKATNGKPISGPDLWSCKSKVNDANRAPKKLITIAPLAPIIDPSPHKAHQHDACQAGAQGGFCDRPSLLQKPTALRKAFSHADRGGSRDEQLAGVVSRNQAANDQTWILRYTLSAARCLRGERRGRTMICLIMILLI